MSLLTGLSPYLEEIKLGALIVAAGAIFAGGYHLGGLGPKADLQALQAADWQAKFTASQVALTAVKKQLEQAAVVTQNNSKAMKDLNDANAKITAARDSNLELAQRLLNAARSAPAIGAAVPKSGDRQPAPGPAGNPSAGPTQGLLVDAADESAQCAASYNTLLAELKSQ